MVYLKFVESINIAVLEDFCKMIELERIKIHINHTFA